MRTIGLVFGVLAAVLAAACGGGGGPARVARLEAAPAVIEVTEHLEAAVTVTAVMDDGTSRDVTAEAVLTVTDPAVAAVSAGKVRGVAPGGTFLVASWGGLRSSVRVAVLPAELLSLRITTAGGPVPAGAVTQVIALGAFSDGTERDVTALVTWHAVPVDEACELEEAETEEEPAEVDEEGHFTGRYACDVTLTASLGGLTAGAPLLVTAAAPTGLSLDLPATAPVGIRASARVLATLTDGTTRDVTAAAAVWTDDDAVARWSPADLAVQARAVGATTVRASWQGLEAAAAFEATPAVLAAIEIPAPEAEVKPGRLLTFTALGRWTDGRLVPMSSVVAWSSSDEAVAVPYPFLGAGKILARAAGTAWVVATDPASGLSGRYQLVVPRE